jgi:hypothetical protein
MKINIIDAIIVIKKDAQVSCSGDDINTLEWHDNNPTNITNQQILDKQSELQAEYDSKEYQRNRANEYPDFKEYLDGIVKGDDAQIQKYINDCLAVKAKYPKE